RKEQNAYERDYMALRPLADKAKAQWVVVGDAAEVTRSKERTALVDVLFEAGTPLSYPAAKMALWRMAQACDLVSKSGKYPLAPSRGPPAPSSARSHATAKRGAAEPAWRKDGPRLRKLEDAMDTPLFLGIDVAQAHLDIAVRPTGEQWRATPDES